MSRIKKSRTAGNSDAKPTERPSTAKTAGEDKRKSKLKGNKAGARNAIESTQTQQQNAKQAANNKRLGSQKAVRLVPDQGSPAAPEKVTKATPQSKQQALTKEAAVKLSPEKELAAIENDERLNALLEQLDSEESISSTDKSWMNKQTLRHQQLMKQLGWLDEEGEEDLLQQFDDASSALNEFKY